MRRIDVFGNGKTAVKTNLGKYLEGVGVQLTYANSNPTLRVPTTTGPFGVLGVVQDVDRRGWGSRRPTATFSNPQRAWQSCGGQRRWRSRFLRPDCPTRRFGQPVLTGDYDPDLLSGWGVRAADWSFGVSVQQQIMARMSIEVGYYRRWFDGFTLNDNRSLQPEDLTPYTIVAPLDPRLPDGGGYPIGTSL